MTDIQLTARNENEVELGARKKIARLGLRQDNLQDKLLGVGLPTRYSALVGFVPCVCPDVLLKVGQLSELALADLTPVRLDSQVDPCMLGEVGAVGKSLSATCTLIWFWFPQVYLCVELEVRLRGKSLKVNSLDVVREADIARTDV